MSDILFELGTEELPPKALNTLAESLYQGVTEGLIKANLNFDSNNSRWYASPRRLAFILKDIDEKQPDQVIQRKGPAIAAAFDPEGNPKPAALGFARSVGAEVAELQRLKTDKGEWLVYDIHEKGQDSSEILAELIKSSIKNLPIPKPMRWGNHSFHFIRPVHWIVFMKDTDVLPLDIFAKSAGNKTRGHRFHAPDFIEIQSAQSYVDQLRSVKVEVDQELRKENIKQQVLDTAKSMNATAQIDEGLLQEVVAIVEHPVATVGNFDDEFLKVPPEALISSMQKHQKYFPLFDQNGTLISKFIAFANIESKDVSQVIKGFEKVITPRLADARFFWEQDQKTPLQDRFAMLEKMTFEKSLGSLADKSHRVAKIMGYLAEKMDLSMTQGQRAAQLSKCDLLTDMVDEFPDLQGIMGGYYATAQEENENVADALRNQYKPSFSGDSIPQNPLAQALSIADKVDTLCGIFAVGKKPTGNKDPFALRRATLGIIRILQEGKLPVDLYQLIEVSCNGIEFDGYDMSSTKQEVLAFIEQRIKHHYLEKDVSHDIVDAVLTLKPGNLFDADMRINACQRFKTDSSAAALAAANKRIANILKKSVDSENESVQLNLLIEDQEKNLYGAIESMRRKFIEEVSSHEYNLAFKHLSSLAEPVDAFFEHVMVNAEDPQIRDNRLALLKQLHELFSAIADIAKLEI